MEDLNDVLVNKFEWNFSNRFMWYITVFIGRFGSNFWNVASIKYYLLEHLLQIKKELNLKCEDSVSFLGTINILFIYLSILV